MYVTLPAYLCSPNTAILAPTEWHSTHQLPGSQHAPWEKETVSSTELIKVKNKYGVTNKYTKLHDKPCVTVVFHLQSKAQPSRFGARTVTVVNFHFHQTLLHFAKNATDTSPILFFFPLVYSLIVTGGFFRLIARHWSTHLVPPTWPALVWEGVLICVPPVCVEYCM